MPECHTLIISDIHLGSRVCRADKLLGLLGSARFDDLVINGDLFDSDDPRKLTDKHWRIIDALADIARERSVLLVGGNHGRKLDHLAEKAGIRVVDDHAFALGDKTFLCMHGDEFDVFTRRLPRTSVFFAGVYEALQGLGGEKQRFSMFMKRISKNILNVPAKQQRRALEHAGTRNASVIICSHTHLPYEREEDGIRFINTGSFCEYPCSYVSVDRAGNARLVEM